jgi:hypothetical protein
MTSVALTRNIFKDVAAVTTTKDSSAISAHTIAFVSCIETNFCAVFPTTEAQPARDSPKGTKLTEQLHAQLVLSSEVAALEASAAANCAELEASLRRTTKEAHFALHTAHTITVALATQTERLTALEVAMGENAVEWHKGRKEMRRTRHWYIALAHWLRCGGSATFRSVASKADPKALLNQKPSGKAGGGHGAGSAALDPVSSQPVQGEGSPIMPLHCSALYRKANSLPASDAAREDEVAALLFDEVSCEKAQALPCAAAARATRLRSALHQGGHRQPSSVQYRADV